MLLADYKGHSAPPVLLDLLENKIMKPASWRTTIFVKPLYILRCLSMVIPWLFYTRRAVCGPRIYGFFEALRKSPPPFPTKDLKIAAAGFCWGGYYTVQLTHDTPESRVVRHDSQIHSGSPERLIDCGFTAHPSNLSIPKDLEGVTLPLSVSIGNEDLAVKTPAIQQMKEILEVKKKGDHEVVIMPGAKHGFAVRTNPEDKLQNECAKKAEAQAIDWFTRWFA